MNKTGNKYCVQEKISWIYQEYDVNIDSGFFKKFQNQNPNFSKSKTEINLSKIISLIKTNNFKFGTLPIQQYFLN